MVVVMATKVETDFDAVIAKFTAKQMIANDALDSGRIKFLLYGGALGGGKSYWLRWTLARRLIELWHRGIGNAIVMLACEDYPSLKDRQLSKIGIEFPRWLGKFHGDHREYGRCYILAPRFGSGVIAFRNLDDPSKYQSAEFAAIGVDELTKNPYDTFTYLRTRLRWPGLKDVECWFLAGTNPGGIGHGWVKQFWMDRFFPKEWIQPRDYRDMFAYIPSLADDNPHLDEAYWQMLETLPEQLRKAFRHGDWETFVGQAFSDVGARHRIDPIWPLPPGVPIYMTFDWGFGRPFSTGWWWVNSDGKLLRFSEWYGWNGNPNQGLRLDDTEVARGIKEREEKMGLHGHKITRIAGPDCFAKKPDYKGGGQGPSTSEVFAGEGLYLTVGDPSRKDKIRQFRERLRNGDDGVPGMLIYDTCENWWRTIPNLVVDKLDIEDIDTDGEDHIYDECCHICMARPMALRKPAPLILPHAKRLDDLYSGRGAGNDEFLEYLWGQREKNPLGVRTFNDPNLSG